LLWWVGGSGGFPKEKILRKESEKTIIEGSLPFPYVFKKTGEKSRNLKILISSTTTGDNLTFRMGGFSKKSPSLKEYRGKGGALTLGAKTNNITRAGKEKVRM